MLRDVVVVRPWVARLPDVNIPPVNLSAAPPIGMLAPSESRLVTPHKAEELSLGEVKSLDGLLCDCGGLPATALAQAGPYILGSHDDAPTSKWSGPRWRARYAPPARL